SLKRNHVDEEIQNGRRILLCGAEGRQRSFGRNEENDPASGSTGGRNNQLQHARLSSQRNTGIVRCLQATHWLLSKTFCNCRIQGGTSRLQNIKGCNPVSA